MRAYYKVNIYGVDVCDGIVLIDCGDEDQAKDLFKSVRMAFKKPVIAVYLTHGHADHAGAGSYFQKKGVPVYSFSYEVPVIQSGAYDPSNLAPDQFTYSGYMPDNLYEYADKIEGFTIEYTPGHSMGSVSIRYDSDYGSYLFTGDSIFEAPSEDPLDYSFILSWYTAYQLWEFSSIPGYPDFIGTWQLRARHGAEYPSLYASSHLGMTGIILAALPYPPA